MKSRVSLNIDSELLHEAHRVAGLKSTREVVELGLRMLVRLHEQAQIRRFRGKLDWKDDLEEVRSIDR